MRTRTITVSVIFEPIVGTAIFCLTLWVWWHIFMTAGSGASVEITFLLLFIVPGLLVLIGSYLQAIRGTRWPALLVLLGGIWNLLIVGYGLNVFLIVVPDNSGIVAAPPPNKLDASRGSVFRMKHL